jgi:phage gpG-like protein
VEYMLKVLNAKRISTRFERTGLAAIHAEPAMESLAELMFRIFSATFDSQGRRGGGSWRRDTAEWMSRKLRLGLDPNINQASLALRNAFTIRDAPHQELHITPTTVNLSTDLPYAAVTQRNRPFVKFTTGDRLRARAIVRDYLIAAWRAV